jgi:hypothetical protein
MTPTTFNGQEIIDQHLPERLTPNYYEMLTPSQETNGVDMNIIKNISSYLRNDRNQRRYSGGGPIGFIVTREHRPGHYYGIIHFYTEGVYRLAEHYIKADGSALPRNQGARS